MLNALLQQEAMSFAQVMGPHCLLGKFVWREASPDQPLPIKNLVVVVYYCCGAAMVAVAFSCMESGLLPMFAMGNDWFATDEYEFCSSAHNENDGDDDDDDDDNGIDVAPAA
ncbi:hypothetical protein RIF29_17865 [Crotalaria pallida]|uniref:Uncharacterized protein n=1 Tax=Crotalaria pallida TaxID=3830 RepID=A0AAN9FNS0_CROPI